MMHKVTRLIMTLHRRLHRQHYLAILLPDQSSAQIPARHRIAPRRQLPRILHLPDLAFCFYLGEQEEGTSGGGEWCDARGRDCILRYDRQAEP
jgi:hypothetical protein